MLGIDILRVLCKLHFTHVATTGVRALTTYVRTLYNVRRDSNVRRENEPCDEGDHGTTKIYS